MRKDLVAQVIKHAVTPVESKKDIAFSKLVPTGCTLLNLAISDRAFGGFGLGKIVNIIGDQSSGKTMLSFSVMAEAAQLERFSEYKFIHDDVEAANEFDIPKLFGEKLAKRIQPPGGTRENPRNSQTIEELQVHLHGLIKKGVPFIYILDSLDALSSDEDKQRMEDRVKAYKTGKATKGSYQMSKPKMMSEILRQIVAELKNTQSLLIIVSQTRDNINPMSFATKIRSGGRALEFYSSHILWTAIAGKIKNMNQTVGILCKVKSSKSKLTGKVREVIFPIYYDYGVDDLGACVRFLVEQGEWKKTGSLIRPESLTLEPAKEGKLIRQIEKTGQERQLKKITGQVWRKIEDKLRLDRKPKYL